MNHAFTLRLRAATCLLALAGTCAASWSASAALAGDKPAAQATTRPVTAACSIHLFYKAPEATSFYNEVTVEQSARGSFFATCGFQAGYFGLQELANGKKVVIFSVWDAPAGDNPKAVAKDKQVQVLYKADEVRTERFGGEGTGQKSFFDYDWKNGQAYRFLVKAVTVDGTPAYAAYFFVPETKSWKHLATFHTPHNDNHIADYYSFVEDFHRNTTSVGQTRRAVFSNGAVCDASGAWHAMGQAKFNASTAPTEAFHQIDAGAVANGFFLQTGGNTQTHTKVYSMMERQAVVAAVADLPQR